MQLRGVVVSGQGRGRHFTGLSWARAQFVEKLGIDPYPGTLNLRLAETATRQHWQQLRTRPAELIRAGESGACDARCFHVDVEHAGRTVAAALVWPLVDAYPDDQLELIAPCNLRQALRLTDGAEIAVRLVVPAEALRRTVQAFLAAHNVMSLATHGEDGPWAASVFYVHLGWTFYFLSSPESRHSQHLAANARVAATINPDYTNWREIRGVQLEGMAAVVSSPLELQRGMAAYRRKYPFLAQQGQPPAELARALSRVRLYRLVPERLLFVDNSRGFGHREEVEMMAASSAQKE